MDRAEHSEWRGRKDFGNVGKARGVHVLNLVRRDAGVQELAALGIGNALSTAQPDWQERARSILGGSLARAAVDSIEAPPVHPY